jgi:hypothetical protein
VRGSSEEKWFSEQYAPWLETTLRNAIEQEIAPKHTDCLGNNPQQIEVVIEEISEKDLELGCDDGTVIDTLQSMSLTDEPLRDRNCDECSSVDFSTYTSDGKIAEKGDYVSNEWKPEHGFTITASGGYNPESKARIFDTADQACVSSANGSLEFGSPNKNCENGGHGHGDGGKPGESGENCEPVGSKYDAQQSPTALFTMSLSSITLTSSLLLCSTDVLIVQESDKSCPDSNPQGGTLKFVFDTPVLVSDIGLMDVDEEEQRIRITYDDGVSELFAYSGFGDNAVQRVICNKLNVKELEVIFPGTGAVTELNFCPECRPLTTTHGNCLTTQRGGNINAWEEIAFDRFTGKNREAITGWKSARQGNSRGKLYKEYKVPRDARHVTFELDLYAIDHGDLSSLYEIDFWGDTRGDSGEDASNIYVDGEKVALGVFREEYDKKRFSGSTKHGITWTCSKPESEHRYEKYHINIEVPATTGLMKDGKLRLTLTAALSQSLRLKGVYWDNVKVTVGHGCNRINPQGTAPTRAPIEKASLPLSPPPQGTAPTRAPIEKASLPLSPPPQGTAPTRAPTTHSPTGKKGKKRGKKRR